MLNESYGAEVYRLSELRRVQSVWAYAPWEILTKANLNTEPKLLNNLQNGVPMDFWDYQTCTEFAFYQTCETGSDCFFLQGLMTLDIFLTYQNSATTSELNSRQI